VETAVQKLCCLPNYQLSLDRRNPALKQLQNWLKDHAADGHVTRQGTLSMILDYFHVSCSFDLILSATRETVSMIRQCIRQ
jgi:hypothetical protein